MNWQKLNDIEQLKAIKLESETSPVLIFKHSTRCSISTTSLSKFERNWDDAKSKGIKPYFLDLLASKPISHEVEKEFSVEHQSPQVLLIKDGKCVFDASHMSISFNEVVSHA